MLHECCIREKLSEARFQMLSDDYEQEQAELDNMISEDQTKLDTFQMDTARVEQFMALVKKYRDFSMLTTPMINAFIEKILVHEPYRDEYGDRCQEVEIYLNFIGKFDVPTPEPTPEEQAELEAQRKKRAAYRQKYERKKERERQIEAGLIVPGEPYTLTCQYCGEHFQSTRYNATFCNASCRARFYRQEAREAKQKEMQDETA